MDVKSQLTNFIESVKKIQNPKEIDYEKLRKEQENQSKIKRP